VTEDWVEIGTINGLLKGDCSRELKKAGYRFKFEKPRREYRKHNLVWLLNMFVVLIPFMPFLSSHDDYPLLVPKDAALDAGGVLFKKGILQDVHGNQVMNWRETHERLSARWTSS
jgi:hypothetical protein